MLTRKKVQTTLLLIFGIVIIVNILSDRIFLRLDFTEDQRYSLSKATKDILSSLDDPVTVSAYFSEDLPPDVAKVRSDFKDLLVEYSNYSGGQVVYDFVNPNADQETEMKAQQEGIRPIMINVRERDQVKQQRAYLGAIVQLGDKKDVIPFIQPGSAMEYALSSSIKKIAAKERSKVAFLQGDGEPSLNAMQQMNEPLSVLHDVTTINFHDTLGVPGDISTLAIVAPKDTIPGAFFVYLDQFLSRGGRLLLALNTVDRNQETGVGEKVYTGLENWLNNYGIEISDNFLVDVNCSNVMVRQQQGYFVINTPVRFPYIPIITEFAQHPITKGLEAVVLPFVSPVRVTQRDTSISVIPLATSSDKSGIQKAPVYFDINKQWGATDFTLPRLPVAVAIEGKLAGSINNKMVVFGDGDFAVNGEGQNAQQVQPDNVNLMVNAIDWLSDDTGLVELRTKGVTSRPIDQTLEDGTKTFLKYFNFLVPILLVIAYGFYRFQVRRKLRNNLMNVDYV
ncbi:MAG: hypothetical protein A2V66_00650 [Ignavibacteria bacterium RBG_13_36_8]|nr:MAG: hypothetical protein A2V66_00650 [Ignavibacteria bacterium RBG_13_36_8]